MLVCFVAFWIRSGSRFYIRLMALLVFGKKSKKQSIFSTGQTSEIVFQPFCG
jgi:hypothetical protein